MNSVHNPSGRPRQTVPPDMAATQLAHMPLLALLLLVFLLIPVEVVWPAETAAPSEVVQPASSGVNQETLNARLKEVESATSLDDETRASLTEMINKALANLETARTNEKTTQEYIRLRESAAEMTKAIRA